MIMRVFSLKVRKFLKFGEIRDCGEKEMFFRRKTFSSFKSHLNKNEKAGNMPVVAGRLVIFRHMIFNVGKINHAIGSFFRSIFAD